MNNIAFAGHFIKMKGHVNCKSKENHNNFEFNRDGGTLLIVATKDMFKGSELF